MLKRKYILLVFSATIVIFSFVFLVFRDPFKQWRYASPVPFNLHDLEKVHWDEGKTFQDLKKKRIIAIGFYFFNGRAMQPLKVVTDPHLVYKIVDALLTAKMLKAPQYPGHCALQPVFADNTGFRIRFRIDTPTKTIDGDIWESKKMYKLYYEVFPPNEK